jgi:hypothetical protein
MTQRVSAVLQTRMIAEVYECGESFVLRFMKLFQRRGFNLLRCHNGCPKKIHSRAG